MYHLIYKITNTINGKYYLGKHSTQIINDGYLGSGKLIRKAVTKYGKENFKKDILFIFNNEEEALKKEKELVNENLIKDKNTYNLTIGGLGSWYHVDSKASSIKGNLALIEKRKNADFDKKYRENVSIGLKNAKDNGSFINNFKNHTEESKRKIGKANSLKQSGDGNSQYGTIWITNGEENKKIKKEDKIPNGWYKGRKTNKFYMNNGLVEKLFTKDQLEINLNNGWNIGRLPDKKETCWIMNLKLKKTKKIHIDELDYYISIDWIPGRKQKW